MTPFVDRVGEAADAGRDDGSAVGHRLTRGDAVALTPRGDAHDRRALVVGADLVVWDEADGRGHEVAERAVADDDEREPGGRLDELADALLLRETADVEDVRRLLGRR